MHARNHPTEPTIYISMCGAPPAPLRAASPRAKHAHSGLRYKSFIGGNSQEVCKRTWCQTTPRSESGRGMETYRVACVKSIAAPPFPAGPMSSRPKGSRRPLRAGTVGGDALRHDTA